MKIVKKIILIGVLLSPAAWAQDKNPFDTGGGSDPDPFGSGKAKPVPKAKVGKVDPGFTLTVEVFAISMTKVAEMKRARLGKGETYKALIKEVKEGRGIQEKLMEVRTVNEETVTIEHVQEYTYPTEYDPPEVGELPEKLPAGFKDFDKFITPALPSAFDTKKLGDIVEATLSRNREHTEAITGRITFSHVSFEGMVPWGEKQSKVEMPKFQVQKISSAVNLKVNAPLLLGTLKAPSQVDQKKDKVWVVFATVFEETR